MLNCIVSLVLKEISPCVKLYADLPGLRASESPLATLPTDLSTSTARPDIVTTPAQPPTEQHACSAFLCRQTDMICALADFDICTHFFFEC